MTKKFKNEKKNPKMKFKKKSSNMNKKLFQKITIPLLSQVSICDGI